MGTSKVEVDLDRKEEDKPSGKKGVRIGKASRARSLELLRG